MYGRRGIACVRSCAVASLSSHGELRRLVARLVRSSLVDAVAALHWLSAVRVWTGVRPRVGLDGLSSVVRDVHHRDGLSLVGHDDARLVHLGDLHGGAVVEFHVVAGLALKNTQPRTHVQRRNKGNDI